MALRMVLDLETRCDISVVDVGPHKYAAHPSNEILCFGWRVNDGSPAKVAIAVGGSDGRAAVERRVRDAGRVVSTKEEFVHDWRRSAVKVAHNFEFEANVLQRHTPELLPWEVHWSCTASRARRLGLPGSLGDACRVLKTPHQKSEEGHATMLMVSQPRPVWRKDPRQQKWMDDADRLAKTAVYCVDDILAEDDLDRYLPELPESERRFWEQTTRCNRRGIRLDGALIDAMARVVEVSSASALDDVRRATGDPNFELTNVNSIRSFCADRGVYLDDVRAATVEAKLAAHRSGARRIDEAAAIVLEARQQSGGKSSNAKLISMRDRMMEDDVARDNIIFYGAHTGRDTGSGVNVLNQPKPFEGYEQDEMVRAILTRDVHLIAQVASQQASKKQGRPTRSSADTAVSATIRGLTIPRDGMRFAIGDYSSVEANFLMAAAHQWDAVEMLRNKEDIYCRFGSDIMGRTITKEHDSLLRTVFKESVLGCGFGMGLAKFEARLETKGIEVEPTLRAKAHAGYRTRFPKVPDFWKGVENAAKEAIRNPGRAFSYNEITYHGDGWWLVCTLPGGCGTIYYPNARLSTGKFGDDEIIYEGWVRIDGRPAGWGDVRTWGGSLTENICQAGCRVLMEEHEAQVEALPGWNMTMTVYDELVAEFPDALAPGEGIKTLLGIMSQPPRWLPQMPVRAEGFEAMRYRKD